MKIETKKREKVSEISIFNNGKKKENRKIECHHSFSIRDFSMKIDTFPHSRETFNNNKWRK